jgi:glutamate N-acetyltransferase/amino-acid N-acetyltransferase
MDPEKITLGLEGESPTGSRLSLQKVSLVEKGCIVEGILDQAREIMRGDSIIINIDLGLGEACARGFGCDLTHEYVNVNANYTT